MRQIGLVLRGHTAPDHRTLPTPEQLSSRDAINLGTELCDAAAYELAAVYLMRGTEDAPSAYVWCRLGDVCRKLGRPNQAVFCYRQALDLEPGQRFAVVGLALSLAECELVELADLVEVTGPLMGLMREPHARPAAWALVHVLRAIVRRFPGEPAIHQLLRDAEAFARSLNSGAARDFDADIERRLRAVVRLGDLTLADPSHDSGSVLHRRPGQPHVDGGPVAAQLPVGT